MGEGGMSHATKVENGLKKLFRLSSNVWYYGNVLCTITQWFWGCRWNV